MTANCCPSSSPKIVQPQPRWTLIYNFALKFDADGARYEAVIDVLAHPDDGSRKTLRINWLNKFAGSESDPWAPGEYDLRVQQALVLAHEYIRVETGF